MVWGRGSLRQVGNGATTDAGFQGSGDHASGSTDLKFRNSGRGSPSKAGLWAASRSIRWGGRWSAAVIRRGPPAAGGREPASRHGHGRQGLLEPLQLALVLQPHGQRPAVARSSRHWHRAGAGPRWAAAQSCSSSCSSVSGSSTTFHLATKVEALVSCPKACCNAVMASAPAGSNSADAGGGSQPSPCNPAAQPWPSQRQGTGNSVLTRSFSSAALNSAGSVDCRSARACS